MKNRTIYPTLRHWWKIVHEQNWNWILLWIMFDIAFRYIRGKTFCHLGYQLRKTLSYFIRKINIFSVGFLWIFFQALFLACVGFKGDFDVKSWPNTFRSNAKWIHEENWSGNWISFVCANTEYIDNGFFSLYFLLLFLWAFHHSSSE